MKVTAVVDVSHHFSKGNSRAELAGSLPVLTLPARPVSPMESPSRRRAERPSPFSLLFLVVVTSVPARAGLDLGVNRPFHCRELILSFREVLAQE